MGGSVNIWPIGQSRQLNRAIRLDRFPRLPFIRPRIRPVEVIVYLSRDLVVGHAHGLAPSIIALLEELHRTFGMKKAGTLWPVKLNLFTPVGSFGPSLTNQPGVELLIRNLNEVVEQFPPGIGVEMPANLKIEAKQRLRLTFSLNTNAGQVKRRIESVKGIRYVEIVREATIPSRPATSAPPVLGPSAPSPKTPSILGTPSISSYWAQDFVAKSKMPQGLKLTNIAILDSGVDIEHLALKNSVYCTDKESKVDPSGHGTFVAGIIVGRSSPAGATSPNSDTIDGMLPDSKAWMCTVIDPVGVNWGGGNLTYFVDPGWYSWGLNKIAYDRENNITTGQGNIQVVNLSLGSEAWSYTEALDIQRVINSGCAIVAASGNRSYYSDYAMYPAILPGVIAVGAYKYQNKSELWDWTNSRGVDESSFITAPGEGIFSCVPTKPNGMGIEFSGWSSGTSFAAPFVTAMAAAWLSIPNNQPKKLMAGIGFGGSETEWPTLLWK